MRERDHDRAYALKYFTLYCEAREYGFRDDMAMLLRYIWQLGYEVRAKGGMVYLYDPQEK